MDKKKGRKIARRFGSTFTYLLSKSQAGRLVMTESAAFANEARKDCFKDLGVERYVIVETPRQRDLQPLRRA